MEPRLNQRTIMLDHRPAAPADFEFAFDMKHQGIGSAVLAAVLERGSDSEARPAGIPEMESRGFALREMRVHP
jgi:hypothetical protein